MTASTMSDFKTDIYTRDIQLPDLPSDASFFSLFNRAITNVRAELRGFEPDKFETWLEGQTSPVAFPSDLVKNEITLFYPKDQYQNPIGGQYISQRNGSWYVEAFANFGIKYPNDIARITDLSDPFPFTSEKSEEILISEMMALINLAYEQNEATAATSNAITQSNRVR
jgi:hypothetical protein